jgi:hypothetical protein
MSHRDIVVIGASAGGIEALQQIARALPAALPATIFVTVHFPMQASSALPRILARAGSLAAHTPSTVKCSAVRESTSLRRTHTFCLWEKRFIYGPESMEIDRRSIRCFEARHSRLVAE